MSNKTSNLIPCVAFFTLKDFIDEMRRVAFTDDARIVRVEAPTTTTYGQPSGAVRYEVWVSACPNGQVLAARFLVGRDLAVFADLHGYHRRNLERAKAIIQARLEAAGFDVRPGILAHDTNVEAGGEWLWRFNDDKELVEVK